MKINKMICIDEEIIREVIAKGFNFSSMTNDLWEKYLSNPQKYEEIKIKIKEKRLEIEEKKNEIIILRKSLRKIHKNLLKIKHNKEPNRSRIDEYDEEIRSKLKKWKEEKNVLEKKTRSK